MIKTDLPVVVLKDVPLLPSNIIRIELDDHYKNIIDVSELFHDNYILVVNFNTKEEKINSKQMPKIGIIAKIDQRMSLPDKRIRITIKALYRATIHEYLNHNPEILEAIISRTDKKVEKEQMLLGKLKKEFDKCVKNIPYISNELMAQVEKENSLSKTIDMMAFHIVKSDGRISEYLHTVDPAIRAKMLLEDIYKEEELYKLDDELDTKVKQELDVNQKAIILREKIRVIQEELGEVSSKDEDVNALRTRIDLLDCPKEIKIKLNQELKKYQDLSTISPEMSIVRNYIEYLLSLPWNQKTVDNDDLMSAKKILDEEHFGIDHVKNRIIEFLAVKKNSHHQSGAIICLVGPPGIGKTTLANSIAKAMNRNFVKISLGGINDTSEILGHRRTYIGASPGKIISSIKKSRSNNPVFLIDEIDKISKGNLGDPASALLDVLDASQNEHFMDNYIEEEFDLSNVFFILTANSVANIPIALKDRLEIIELTGYTDFEKVIISEKYLIPKLCIENGLAEFIMKKEDILFVIQNYTSESGVRELKRKLDMIIRKLVTSNILEKKNNKKISQKQIEQYLGIIHNKNKLDNKIGVVNGLSYTDIGGDVIIIEAGSYKGTGKLILTGLLGEITKESAEIAFSYVKANHKLYHIDFNKFINYDIHIHILEGSIRKDGPSAGIAFVSAIISVLTGKIVKSNMAMTGEITLNGNILPVGGIKEKSIGALRNQIKEVIIPYNNEKDLETLGSEVKNNINYIKVKEYKEVVDFIFEGSEIK